MDSPIGLTAGPVILTVPKCLYNFGTVSIVEGVAAVVKSMRSSQKGVPPFPAIPLFKGMAMAATHYDVSHRSKGSKGTRQSIKGSSSLTKDPGLEIMGLTGEPY